MGGGSTEISDATTQTSCWRRRTGTRRRWRARRAGTSCPARRPSASSDPSTRSCRRSPPSARPGCSSSTAAARSRPGRTDAGAASRRRSRPDAAGAARPGRRRDLPARGHRAPAGAGRLRGGARDRRRRPRRRRRDPAVLAPGPAIPADLVEEVLRLEGLDKIPSVLPAAPAGAWPHAVAAAAARGVEGIGRGRSASRCCRSRSSRRRCGTRSGLRADDVRRRTVHVANPLDAERAELSTTLLPGLLDALVRNRARGAVDLALYTVGQVVLPHAQPVPMPDPASPAADGRRDRRRSRPRSPPSPCTSVWCWPVTGTHAAGGAPGGRRRWADAVEAARRSAQAAGVELRVTAAALAPWHPGRCAALRVGDWVVGHAGELHPKVVEALELPPRTCAMELDLDALPLSDSRPAPRISPYPPIACGRRARDRRRRCRPLTWPRR